MSRKYKITESQLSKIYERLALSENDNMEGSSMEDESTMYEETMEDDEDVKTESEKPWGKDKGYAPEAHNSKHMAGKMNEELGQAKFSGKSVNGGVSTQTWDKATKTGKTVTGGLKSGGTAKANNGQWADVKKTSKEATSQVVKGMTAGDVKNSMGVKQPVTKPYDQTKISSKEAKAHVKGSLKSGGASKNIEGAKASEKNWDKAKGGSVNEKRDSAPSQMRDKKKAAMEEMAKRMDKEAGK